MNEPLIGSAENNAAKAQLLDDEEVEKMQAEAEKKKVEDEQ